MASSILIVKNLPQKVTEDKVRAAFSTLGGGPDGGRSVRVNSVQLKYTKEGKFRQFGFVGFHTAEEAEAAREYLDGTFLGAAKIRVERSVDPGAKTGKGERPRPWSKHSRQKQEEQEELEKKEREEEAKKQKEKKKKKQKDKAELDPVLKPYAGDEKFQEFVRAHQQGKEGGVWDNDLLLAGAKVAADKDVDDVDEKPEEPSQSDVESDDDNEREEEDEKTALADNKALSDLAYLQAKTADSKGAAVKGSDEAKDKTKKKKKAPRNEEYMTVKISGLPYATKKKDVKGFLRDWGLGARSIRVPKNIKSIAYVGFTVEADYKKALNKNKSFVKGNQVFVQAFTSSSSSSSRPDKWKEQEESVKSIEETVAESGRIFVRNLNYTATEDDLESLFKTYGPLAEISLPVDRLTRKIKGFAFVTYVMPEHAAKAFSELDGTSFQGRLLHLIPAKPKAGDDVDGDDDDGNTTSDYKKKKELKQKKEAGSSHNWNTLFLGASAVADLMSERYGVDKSAVLTGGGGEGKPKQSAAVTLALGETQIVADTRAFLEEQGVSLDAFSQQPASKRSKTVLIVKNLPARTAVEQIRDLFARHGELGRVVLPPGCVTAVVEFLSAGDAKKAFRGLAYSKFRNAPLYLEWAPEQAFSGAPPSPKPAAEVEEAEAAGLAAQPDDEPEPNTTIFVKNLNFDTMENVLREHFSSAGTVHSVTVAMKKDAKRPGEMLSMGYGFVQYKRAKSADQALKTLQQKMLDFHTLELKRSNRAASSAAGEEVRTARKRSAGPGATEDGATKMMVRNVPFEAKQKDIEDIFKTFGELKSVRLPKKATGSHRGFAFVEFETKGDAKRAMDALCHSTHLYGRRLVLEWAEQEETLESLRRKTASQYAGGAEPANKRVKKSQVMESVVLAGGKS